MKSRILVVDDEESIREFLDIMLRKEGYEVTVAEDGARAIELLKKKSFDLIISDLQMPHVTGIALLKHVKESYPDIVFMLITAFGTTETAVEAMKMGAYDCVAAPFERFDVLAAAKRASAAHGRTLFVSKVKPRPRKLHEHLPRPFRGWSVRGTREATMS